MGINLFVLGLIVISIIVTNINIEEKQEQIQYTTIPLVTFEDSTMYKLNEQKVSRIINSSQALNYKNRDELYDATIIVRNKMQNADLVSAEYILKKDKFYKLYQNAVVDIKADNNISLSSDYIEFDQLNNIIITKNEFNLKINKSQLLGKNLYFDASKEIVKAHKAHFTMKIKEEKK